MSFVVWGLKHRNILIKVYTACCLLWLLIVCLSLSYYVISNPSSSALATAVFGIFLLGVVPLLPLYFLMRREFSRRRFAYVVLDPYLASVREKFAEVSKYFKGEKGVLWGPVVVLSFDAVMCALQRAVIDVKGIRVIEQLRREKKLYFDTLVKILKDEGLIGTDELKELEILKDLRNRVVHEDYHPTKQHALWAYEVARTFIAKRYPEALKA